jgi:hypothetical protein
LAIALLEVLNDSFGLPPVKRVLADRAQTHATDQRGRLAQNTYGYYRCRIPRQGATPERCAIRIYADLAGAAALSDKDLPDLGRLL